jgi:hypothetical protein
MKSRRRIACPRGLGPRRVRELQQGFATGGIGFRHRFAEQQSETADVRFGSKADITRPPAHVRYYPQSDRDSDLPDGRYVPLATKLQCSKRLGYSITSSIGQVLSKGVAGWR